MQPMSGLAEGRVAHLVAHLHRRGFSVANAATSHLLTLLTISHPEHAPHESAQYRCTLRLWHRPFLTFLVHLRSAQTPAWSKQDAVVSDAVVSDKVIR